MSGTEHQARQRKIITTSVPPALASDVERAAREELLSVSSYVRRLLLTATRGNGRAAA